MKRLKETSDGSEVPVTGLAVAIKPNARLQLNRLCLPVLPHGCEMCSTSEALKNKLDTFDLWYIRRIVRILYSIHIRNERNNDVCGHSENAACAPWSCRSCSRR